MGLSIEDLTVRLGGRTVVAEVTAELPKEVDGLSLFHAALAHRIGIA